MAIAPQAPTLRPTADTRPQIESHGRLQGSPTSVVRAPGANSETNRRHQATDRIPRTPAGLPYFPCSRPKRALASRIAVGRQTSTRNASAPPSRRRHASVDGRHMLVLARSRNLSDRRAGRDRGRGAWHPLTDGSGEPCHWALDRAPAGPALPGPRQRWIVADGAAAACWWGRHQTFAGYGDACLQTDGSWRLGQPKLAFR